MIEANRTEPTTSGPINATLNESLFKSLIRSTPVNIPVLTCDYNEDLIDWFGDYEYESQAAGWDYSTRLARLPCYLQGTARSWYSSYGSQVKNYFDLKQLMVLKLCKKEYRSLLENKIFDEKQKSGQPVLAYIMRMEDLI